ncbi:hypothetical protein BJV82DRAFT_667338 [Fennellomyces sp. T-0311]|nr:hypothetical protein BJV82DRAFT_667338 [Fennellomyces sp. T-0311]
MNQVAPRLFYDTDMAKRNDYLITFRAVLMLWRVHPGFWEGVEVPYPKSKKLKDTKEFNEALDIPENLVYKPGKKLLRAIHDDRMNMRIWRRLLSRKYQLETNIHDLMSFCEVALTQLEFQCLLCRSSQRIKAPFDIPLVHPNALHCLRCDYNICSSCNQTPKSRAIKTCPNCLAPNALFSSTTLEGVFAAMNLPRR